MKRRGSAYESEVQSSVSVGGWGVCFVLVDECVGCKEIRTVEVMTPGKKTSDEKVMFVQKRLRGVSHGSVAHSR